jgi:serine/threonine protein phosphatase PrpC
MTPTVRCALMTDIGRVRVANQDCGGILQSEELAGRLDAVLAVADGMGGHGGSDIASRVAVETVLRVVRDSLPALPCPPDDGHLEALAVSGIRQANETVWREASRSPELRGIGTTCVVALIAGDRAVVGHVGDSRAYRLRAGRLERVTEDHSLVGEYVRAGELSEREARTSRFRNVLTRAVGIEQDVAVEARTLDVLEGDRLLLCTDGLTAALGDSQIEAILSQAADATIACRELVRAANAAGGPDNITVAVAERGTPLFGPHSARQTSVPARARRAALPRWRLIAGLLGIALAVWLAVWLVRRPPGREPPPASPSRPPASSVVTSVQVVHGPLRALSQVLLDAAPLAVSATGDVYAVTRAGRAVRLPANGGTPVDMGFPTRPKPASGAMMWAADPWGHLYVVSRTDRCVYRYARSGTRVGVIGRGELKAPDSIAVDHDGNLYVIDAGILKVAPARRDPAR